jgi:hypothetical protein
VEDYPDEFKRGQLRWPKAKALWYAVSEIGEVGLMSSGWLSSPCSLGYVRFTEVANNLLSRPSLGDPDAEDV